MEVLKKDELEVANAMNEAGKSLTVFPRTNLSLHTDTKLSENLGFP